MGHTIQKILQQNSHSLRYEVPKTGTEPAEEGLKCYMEEAKGKSKQFNRAKRKCSQEYVVCNREGSINEQK